MNRVVSVISLFAKRFPAFVFFAAEGIWIANGLTYSNRSENYYFSALMSMWLAFAVAAVSQLFLERSGRRRLLQYLAAGLSVALAIGLAYWFRWMNCLDRDSFAIRFILCMGGFLSLFGYAVAKPSDENRDLPILIGPACLAFGTSMAIAGSLSLVFLALDQLFGVNISRIHEFVWQSVCLAITPSAFVIYATSGSFSAPKKVLRILMDYILAPIFLVNLAILITYFAKCLCRFSLPNGEITWLVSTAATIWLFFRFVYSYADTRFSAFFKRWLGLAILPLLALQSAALKIRIGEYGLTPIRYLAIALTTFFAIAAILSLVSNGRYFRLLYLIFATIAFYSAVGPFNAVDASVIAQKARVKKMFAKAGIEFDEKYLSNTSLLENDETIGAETKKRMLDAISFVRNFRKTRVYYIGDIRGNRYRHSGVASISNPRPISHWRLSEAESITLDIAQYSQVRSAKVHWKGSIGFDATDEEIAEFAEELAPSMARVTADGDETIEVPLWAFAGIWGKNNSGYVVALDVNQRTLDIGNGRMLFLDKGYVMCYKKDQQVPVSATNAVPVSMDIDAFLFTPIDSENQLQ